MMQHSVDTGIVELKGMCIPMQSVRHVLVKSAVMHGRLTTARVTPFVE